MHHLKYIRLDLFAGVWYHKLTENPEFTAIFKQYDIHFEIEREYEYEQANLRMEKL